MIRLTDNSTVLMQCSDLWRWLVLALVAAFLALSCSFLLAPPKEALAKGKQASTGRGSPGGGGDGGATKLAGDALSGATKAAGDATTAGDKEVREKGHRGGTSEPIGTVGEVTKEALEPPGSAPKANKPLSAVEAEPVAKDVDRTLGEVTGTAKPVMEKVAEPTIEGTVDPLVGSVNEETGPLVSPIREMATGTIEPVAKLADEAVEPVLGSTTPVLEPVLGAAGSVTKPVLEGTASLVEPVLEGGAPVAGPIFEEIAPVVAPVLKEANPIVGSPNEAIGQRSQHFDTPLSRAVEPTTTAQVFEPFATTALEPNFGYGGGALPPSPAVATSTTDALAPLSVVSPPALGQVAGDTKANPSPLPLTSSIVEAFPHRSADEYGISSKPFPESSGSSSRATDSSLFGGLRAALLSSAADNVMKVAQEDHRTPLLPFRLPAGTLLVGSSFGGSGMGLDFLAALALLSVFLRIGGSSRSPRDLFKLVSSPRLVIELPG